MKRPRATNVGRTSLPAPLGSPFFITPSVLSMCDPHGEGTIIAIFFFPAALEWPDLLSRVHCINKGTSNTIEMLEMLERLPSLGVLHPRLVSSVVLPNPLMKLG